MCLDRQLGALVHAHIPQVPLIFFRGSMRPGTSSETPILIRMRRATGGEGGRFKVLRPEQPRSGRRAASKAFFFLQGPFPRRVYPWSFDRASWMQPDGWPPCFPLASLIHIVNDVWRRSSDESHRGP